MSIFSRLTKTNNGGSGGSSLQNNYVATTAPSATDDTTAGYEVGSVWIDVTGDEAYRCVDATEASAVWVKTTLSSDEFDTLMASTINSATGKTTPVDADQIGLVDSEASNVLKKLTWANLKATLKTYFDTLYAGVLGADENYVTDAEKVVIGNTSGTNTGDQNLSSYATKTGTETLTNKRINPRVTTEVSSATPTINTDNSDMHSITALAVAITSMTTNLSGTPVNGQKLIIRFKDNATNRAITWGASFEAKGVDLPTTTTASKVLTVGFLYDTVTSKWGCIASVEEA
jgi:lipoprotein-anchoring transpeptidase ErfK/SrfK